MRDLIVSGVEIESDREWNWEFSGQAD